ncbi:MAG: TetR/AcrR family transcriptional regulator [Polyangiaceae bacterium]
MAKRPRTAPRKKPKQERSQATVDAILQATARVLCATGYDRASTNRIALAAGVSVGSLYQYFPSKEALVAALVERHVDEMTSLVKTKLAEVFDAPLASAVETIIGAMFAAHAVDPRLHQVLIEQVPRVGRLEKLRGVEGEVQALVAAFLAARPELCRAPVETMAFVLVHAVEAVTHAAVVGGVDTEHARVAARELTKMVLRYLRVESP